MAKFLANRNRRLFSMSSTENALLTLLREGVSVQESSVDSKRDLETALKAACNDYMDHCAHAMAGELLKLVDQCRAAENGSIAQLALMNADHLLDSLAKAKDDLDKSVDPAVEQLKLYLENPGTQGILLRPVSRKVTRAVEELNRTVSSVKDGELDWDADKRTLAAQLLADMDGTMKKVAKTSAGR
jgi:conserved oligomeric Golgi complex subunit 3